MLLASANFSLIIRHASNTDVLGSNCIILVAFFSGIEIRSDKVDIVTGNGAFCLLKPPESVDCNRKIKVLFFSTEIKLNFVFLSVIKSKDSRRL